MTKLLTAAIAASLAAMPAANAGHRHRRPATIYVNGRTSCGCPMRTERHVVGHDCHGRPVLARRRLPVIHRCHPREVRARVVPRAPCHRNPGCHRGPVFVPPGPSRGRCR